MTILSTLLNATGVILLAHAAYSSYEHSQLDPNTALGASHAKLAASSTSSLPPDIVVEALFSTVLLVFGVVLGSPALRPINWAAWAGEAEKDMRRPKGQKRFENDGGTEGVSMAYLEDRRGFCDIRTQKKEFAEWVRNGGNKSG